MTRATCVLLTGFGPFPGAPANPSATVVRAVARLRAPWRDAVALTTHVFPTDYAAVTRELPALIARHEPHAVVLVGLAARTPWLRIETRAANRASVLLPDAARRRPARGPLQSGGPAHRASRGPLVAIAAALRSAGLDARLSADAGRYLCNAALYRALEPVPGRDGTAVVFFLHLPRPAGRRPLSRVRTRRPSVAMLVRAVEIATRLAAAAARRPDPGWPRRHGA